MSASLNKVMLIGRLGSEVKVHKFEDGNSIANFSLATSEYYKKKDTGDKVEKTEWHKIVAKNRLAVVCDKYLIKGDTIFVEGKLQTRSWEDGGVKKYTTEIVISKIEFINSKNNQDSDDWSISEEDLPF
jgi:single-strand DNA-binding protein